MPASFKTDPTLGEPLGQMNTTPLIDVLLVLLIMMIISIPIATHTVEVDLPGPPDGETGEQVLVSLIVQQSGTVLWDGQPVSKPQLKANLARAASADLTHVIRFEPEANASYDDSVQVINMASDAGIEALAFVGNERHRDFDAE